MAKRLRQRPTQRIRPEIQNYFGLVDAAQLSQADKALIKEKILDQFLAKNEALILEEQEDIPEP